MVNYHLVRLDETVHMSGLVYYGGGWLVVLTSVWSFCLPKHTFLRTNWLGAGRFGWLFLSVCFL